MGNYINAGDCDTCSLHGCTDRLTYNIHWTEANRDLDDIKRREDAGHNRSISHDDRRRRARIGNCVIERPGNWREARFDREESKSSSHRLVNEYVIKIQFHLNIPSMTHVRDITVYEQNMHHAEEVALGKWPNSIVLNSKMTKQNIESDK